MSVTFSSNEKCFKTNQNTSITKYRVLTNDVSDYINLLLRIARIIYNRPLLYVRVIRVIQFRGSD